MRLAALILIFGLSGCSAMCGYHGSGCGYVNERSMALMSAEQLERELSK